jgi:predicted rRNA methylase YqxC with S4 and FtsJ domains
MGDFNEELGSSTRGFTKVITECNLVDVYAATHGLEGKSRPMQEVKNVSTIF